MSRSPIEDLFRDAAAVMWWPELPLTRDCPVTVDGHRYKIDFAVPYWRFGIELDGFRNHSSTADIASDRARQRALERDGWTISRFGGREIARNAAGCVWEAKAPLVALIAEQTSDADRAWFEEHPGTARYFRPHVPGEFPYVYAPGARVFVQKTTWGRVRGVNGRLISGEPEDATPHIAAATPALLDALDEAIREEATRIRGDSS